MLFRENYGTYDGLDGKHRKGQHIVYPRRGYEALRQNANMFVSLCFKGEELLGQAFFLKYTLDNGEICTWVTQLVVHRSYRKRGIATRLLQSVWGFSNYYAWGLATANALTVRALESATWREVSPEVVENHLEIIKTLCQKIPYFKEEDLVVNSAISQIDSHFFPQRKRNVFEEVYVERLGKLPAGYEWLAFTFRSQKMLLSGKHFEQLLSFSQQQLQDAYNRMEMQSHAWAAHTKDEVDFVLSTIPLPVGSKVLDMGCGQGRHSIEFVRHGMQVWGVDMGEGLLQTARKNADSLLSKEQREKLHFDLKDCRRHPYRHLFDLVFCAYDVIGSYRKKSDNAALMDTVVSKVRRGGYAVVSVMNMEYTESIATKCSDVESDPSALLELPASNTMQASGNIFNPEYFLLDKKAHLVYRKEQFEQEGQLSAEYVIADYRYTMGEITHEFLSRGMEILVANYVQSGKWGMPLDARDSHAKEILLVMRKL